MQDHLRRAFDFFSGSLMFYKFTTNNAKNLEKIESKRVLKVKNFIEG
jgi:hypothetical protein